MNIDMFKVKKLIVFLIIFWCSYCGITSLFLLAAGGFDGLTENSPKLIVYLNLSTNPILMLCIFIGWTIIFYGIPIMIADYFTKMFLEEKNEGETKHK